MELARRGKAATGAQAQAPCLGWGPGRQGVTSWAASPTKPHPYHPKSRWTGAHQGGAPSPSHTPRVHTSIPYICVSIPALGLCFKRGETTNQPPVYKLVLNAMKERKAEKGSREYCVGLGFQFL